MYGGTMNLTCETAKQLNLVEFMEKNYRYTFTPKGKSYSSVSPFIDEQNNGFTVSYKHDHWLFHDYASGYCGSIIDFVIYKEVLTGVSEALCFIENHSGKINGTPIESSGAIGYDVAYIYEKIRNNPTEQIQQYLQSRSIPQSLISRFEAQGVLCANSVDNKKYCSFVIRDPQGNIQCIDNHAIEQREKFILGRKGVFTLDWQQLQSSKTIFVCESIIDYMSILAMNGEQIPGMALLGTSLMAAPTLFDKADHIISGFDNDEGGRDGLRRFRHLFGSCRFSSFMMDGCKDANEYLQKNPGKRLQYSLKKLDSDEKCTIALSVNKSSRELAEEYGVHHSTIHDIQKECKQVLHEHLENKPQQTGRPPKAQAYESGMSETEIAGLQKKCALQELQIDYLKLLLKFSHNRLEEATGSKKVVKEQLKKKKKNR
jgi:DNA primase